MMSESSLLKQLARAVMDGQLRADQDPHRPAWHLAPCVGLMNDPNGLIQHKGRFHFFYQWNPLACGHGAKFWGHWSSADLLLWQHEPVALVPAEEYESHGCYSGSAVIHNDRITLVYTGNVKYPDGSRTAFQCLAQENDRGEYDKLGPVLPLPAGYTGHVRDPKVWKQGDSWFMVLGAQDLQLKGKILLARSENMHDWQVLGEIAGSGLGGLDDFGYMWECPDLFELDGKHLLVCCPQGLDAEAERYMNTFQSGYFVGDLDYQQPQFSHGEFHELDLGFEFYAPQTLLTEDGRRLLLGWMGIPDADEMLQPTREYGWMHTMTCPRQLTLENGELRQRPAQELRNLRGNHLYWQGVADNAQRFDVASAEFILHPDAAFRLTVGVALHLDWDGQRLTLSRPALRNGEWEQRYWRGTLQTLNILFDHSSIEIFINEGEAVMSARYFPGAAPLAQFSGDAVLAIDYWPLSGNIQA